MCHKIRYNHTQSVSKTMDHYMYTIQHQGSQQQSTVTQIAIQEIKIHVVGCFFIVFTEYVQLILIFPEDRSRKKVKKDHGITLQKTLIVKFYSGITCLCFPWYLQGSNDCIALKETITNNGCISGMGEKWNFIITAFKSISISTDCCLFLKKKKITEQIQWLWESHPMISHSLVFFHLTKTVHALSCSSAGIVTMQLEAFVRLEFVMQSKTVNNHMFIFF